MSLVKVVVIAGPNRGATYFLEDGENVLGRSPENQIVLASSQVSKKHCALVVKGRHAELKDMGSSNGTFVNGVLAKRKALQNHDRISMGPFVLEVLLPEAVAKVESVAQSYADTSQAPIPEASADPGLFKLEEEAPKSLIGKYKKKFDDAFLPVLYDFYERTEYANLLTMMFAAYLVINLGFSVYPVLQRSREEVLRQAEHQALYISKQMAYLNREAIKEKKESALQTDFAESETNVKEAVIANLEGRIMAPGARLNESYQNPYFLKYKDQLQRRQSIWETPQVKRLVDAEEIVAFTPILVPAPTKGINVPGAISTVIYSTTSIALDSGTIGTVFLEALFWSGLLGMVFLYLVFHVSHRPLEQLVDDMDKVLKGEASSVDKKYKNETIDHLIDTVNSALSRMPQAGGGAQQDSAGEGSTEQVIMNSMMRSVEVLATKFSHAMLMLDTELRVKMVNPAFEELTGIRGALGEVIDSVGRDESFPAMLKELVENAINAGAEGSSEDYDFPSGGRKVQCFAISGMPGRAECYLFLFEKQGD